MNTPSPLIINQDDNENAARYDSSIESSFPDFRTLSHEELLRNYRYTLDYQGYRFVFHLSSDDR